MQGGGVETVQSVDQMLRVYPAFLFGTPLGLIGLCLSGVVMVLTFIGERVKWVWIALVIYITSLGAAIYDSGGGIAMVANHLLPPFEQIRNLNRPLAIFLLLMLSIRAFFSPSGTRTNGVGGVTRAYFVFQIYMCLVLFSGGSSADRGAFGLIVFCLIFVSFGVGLGRWLFGPEQAYTALRQILGVNILLTLGVGCHLVFKPSSMYLAGRLTGTTANPQFLGAFLAFTLPTCYGLLLKNDEATPRRIAAGCGLGLSVSLILMSGSRAAVIVAITGVIVFFRRRLGQFLLTLLVSVVVLLATLQVFGVGGISTHLFSTDNSRAEVWGRLLSEFRANPFFGMRVEQAAGESSYLSVLAIYGLVGAVPFIVAIGLMLRDSVRIIRRRRRFAAHALLADIAVATIAEILISAVFDNHLMATLAPAVFLIYIFLAIYALLLDPAVFGEAPNIFGQQHWQIDTGGFGEVYGGDGFDPVPQSGGFVDPVHQGAPF